MGKWNKASPQISQQFRQNEQRRKQMILQAARRRKQKQRKLQQQVQTQKKNQQQALNKHKQEKQDAYIKYLRNNMHDKYEQIKHQEKQKQPEIRTKSKWKKQTNKNNQSNQLEGLNLQVNIDKNIIRQGQYSKVNKEKGNFNNLNNLNDLNELNNLNKNNNTNIVNATNNINVKRRMLQDEFMKEWSQDNNNIKKTVDNNQMQFSLYDEDDLIGSKLLDSLDLDFETVSRGREYNKKLKDSFLQLSKEEDEKKKQLNQIKNMIGYESVLMSIDQRSQINKKYHQLMVNEVEEKKQGQREQNVQNANMKKSKEKARTIENNDNNKNIKKRSVQKNNNNNNKISKPLNEGEVFNELKNNKQGKILNWANEQAQQAQDLFSNCSTNKKSTRSKGSELLKQINKQIQEKKITSQTNIPTSNVNQVNVNMKKKQTPLETIFEKHLNRSKQRIRERSFEKKNSTLSNNEPVKTQTNSFNQSKQRKKIISQQKQSNPIPIPRPNRLISADNQPPQPIRRIVLRQNSKQKINKTESNGFKQNKFYQQQNKTQFLQRNKSNSHRSQSKEKENNKSNKQIITNNNNKDVQQQKRQQSKQRVTKNVNSQKDILKPKTTHTSLNHLPPMPQQRSQHYQNYYSNNDQITIATQDQVFEVQSFIKNQLLFLNKQQRQLQEQLKNFHIDNKDKLRQIREKYQIKMDYKHSKQLIQGYENDQDSNTSIGYRRAHQKQTEDQLEESIQRLDDMLMRREIIMQKDNVIHEQDNQSESTSRSIINPMSDPIQLHKQILQLAQNLSRFQGEPKDIDQGYGAKLRMMKKNKQKSIQKNQKAQKRHTKYTEVGLSESQDVNYSQLNSNTNTKNSKISKVSRPPQLDYLQNNNYMAPEINMSDILDDELQDSIQKGKIQVNERLKRMLLE